jgi:predicted anti-sigma-YlaC factor YlaD
MRKQAVLILALCGVLAAAPGCAIREYAMRSVGDALAQGGDVYASDDDLEFVGAATPFGLKTIESLLASLPEHRGLLLAAARGFAQYAYVFVQMPADEAEERDVAAAYAQRERARRLFLRARDYGLRGLNLSGPAAAQKLRADPAGALAETAREDVALLYWTALAWGAAISLGKDSPALVAGLPALDALIGRAAALDPDFDSGSLRTLLIGYELSRPGAGADAVGRAREHFARAVALSGGAHAGPYVSLAESVAVARRDRREYEALLRQALALDPGARPEWRLANIVMQRRARWLLSRADELFPE